MNMSKLWRMKGFKCIPDKLGLGIKLEAVLADKTSRGESLDALQCNSSHLEQGRGQGGCIFTFHSCVFVISFKYHKYQCTCGGRNTECTAMQLFTFGTSGGKEVVYCSFCICVLVYLCIFAYYVI